MIFFTSDQHYFHKNVITYCNRPFLSVYEMNEEIIKRHNEVVGENDIVYNLGDFYFGNDAVVLNNIIKKLNGTQYFLKGSHDKLLEHCNSVREIREQGYFIFLSHYSHRRWPRSHYGSYHLYGHSHGKLEDFGYSMDVGVDTNNFYPYSFDKIKEIMSNKVITEYSIYIK